MKSTVQQRIVDLLNEVNSIDPQAMLAIVSHRVPCNQNLADHPTVQVSKNHAVGFLGIVNGLFGDNKICAVMSEDEKIIHRFKVLGAE